MSLLRIWPGEMTDEERASFNSAGDFMRDKGQRQFALMVQKVYKGEWGLFRYRDKETAALVVLNVEEGNLNVYYLTGSGLWGKMRELVGALMDIVKRRRLAALTCVTTERRRARLFGMVPGAETEKVGSRWYLKLELEKYNGWV